MSAVIEAQADRPARAKSRHRFYSLFAIAIALFVIAGFSRTYYLRFLSDLPPLQTLVHLHGAVFTAWLFVFIAQTRFIAARRVDLHMKLGLAALALAAAIVIIGLATIAGRASVPRIHPSGLNPAQFTAIGTVSIALFTAFVALGVAFRKNAAAHKRFMVLAMIATLTPPASRILTMLGLREYFTTLVPVMPAMFVAWCLLYDWRQNRRVHAVFAVGGAATIIAWPLRLWIGRSEWYQPIGEWFVRVGGN
jgi:NADH:ubiquinone oxidoreductase subunit 6 (subunit J)